MRLPPKSSARKAALTRSWPTGPRDRSGSWLPGMSACLAAGPAWRTTAVAPDGLCRETSPPARPEGYGQKLSFYHRNFAASRLRVKSMISARPASWSPGRQPTRARAPARACLSILSFAPKPASFGPASICRPASLPGPGPERNCFILKTEYKLI
jgi:hypothetical protein